MVVSMSFALVTIPDEAQLGPAMRALPTDNMRRFVIALLEIGQLNYTKAAALAGYSQESPGALQVTASRLAHDTRILAAIHEESDRRLHAGAAMAVSQLLLIADAAPKQSDRLKAIEMILNRTGLHAMSEHKVTVNDVSNTDDAMIARIKEIAAKLGLDQSKLLGGAEKVEKAVAEVVDVEYTEHSVEGLEDILCTK